MKKSILLLGFILILLSACSVEEIEQPVSPEINVEKANLLYTQSMLTREGSENSNDSIEGRNCDGEIPKKPVKSGS